MKGGKRKIWRGTETGDRERFKNGRKFRHCHQLPCFVPIISARRRWGQKVSKANLGY